MDDLFATFDRCLVDCFPRHPRPDPDSIKRIEEHFQTALPTTLTNLAKTSDKFHCLFASLGPDFQSPSHIIRINSYWRRRRRTRKIPTSYVGLTLGFDEQLDCLCIPEIPGDPEGYPVITWSPSVESPVIHKSFQEYLACLVSNWTSKEKT